MEPLDHKPRGSELLVKSTSALLFFIGLVLTCGGAWLLWLGGSAYYVLAGIGLMASGLFMGFGRAWGAWIYFAVYICTLLWSFWESGTDFWALIPRTVGPTVLFFLVLTCLPVLSARMSRAFVTGVAVVWALIFLTGASVIYSGEPAEGVAFPAAGSIAMSEPSLRTTGEDWPAYGGTYSARRYSPLTEITPDNVDSLKRAWLYHTRDLPHDDVTKNKYGAETTPLKIADTLYLCSAKNILVALDPATGKERWRYDPKVDDKYIPYTAACRGVSYYDVPRAAPGDVCATRIVEGTLDARILEVDAKTGKPCTGFGNNGQVDITKGMGKVVPGMVSITSAPTIVRGIIITGHQVLDGQKLNAPSGVIHGYDAVTGELKWAWDMTHPAWSGYPPEGEAYTRGTPNMWTTASGDEKLGLVYLPLGNAAVDYLSSRRSDLENKYATSLVALDVRTGKPRWSFQAVRKDVWDYDFGAQATLVDFPTDDGLIPALVLPSKQGDIYVLDRRTGKPLTAIGTMQAPIGGVEPEERAPTQIYSKYHTLRKPALTERQMWGISPIDQMVCRIQFKLAHYEGFFTPPAADGHSIEYPGYNGGTDWGGIAVDPVRGVIVANYNDMPNYNQLVPRDRADRLGWAPRGQERGEMGGAEGAGDPQAGTPFAINVNAGWRLPFTKMLCKEPPYGGIRAIDLRNGKTIWDRPLGTARQNGPFGIPSYLPLNIGTPNNGGAVVTASGVIFIAAATDNLIRAIDLKTGKTLWSDVLPAGGQATPMTYEYNGKQYLVIMAGGHHFMETPIGDELLAYALPD